jgi:hypothetical protein
MREPSEEPVSRRELRRQVFRWIRIHQVYLLPNGHRWHSFPLPEPISDPS